MSAPPNYILGQSVHEQERLMLQARILRPYTERYFRAAGITQGMRVLDVGSGMGDVALLAADLVGPRGHVVGIDRDAVALDGARRRAVEQACSSWASFQATNIDDFQGAEPFDALVGRLVLIYQPDAPGTIRKLLRFVKPGGTIVFHEMDFSDVQPSFPKCESWDRVYGLLGEAFSKAGLNPGFGRCLSKTFLDAGLPFPEVACEVVMGGARGSYVYPWIANTLLSVAPRLVQLGIDVPPELPLDPSLAEKLEEAGVGLGCQLMGPMQFGAWARKP